MKDRIDKGYGWSYDVIVDGELRFEYYYDNKENNSIFNDLKTNDKLNYWSWSSTKIST